MCSRGMHVCHAMHDTLALVKQGKRKRTVTAGNGHGQFWWGRERSLGTQDSARAQVEQEP